jgi:hypothetical protein
LAQGSFGTLRKTSKGSRAILRVRVIGSNLSKAGSKNLKGFSKEYNMIIELSAQGRLRGYYNGEKQVLEHYKFKGKLLRSRFFG